MSILIAWAAVVVYLDPFFHYHRPLEQYYYTRSEKIERYCNDGVLRNFEYDAIITGVSVSQGFSTSELDRLFGTKSEKVIYSGGTFKEIGEGVSRALEANPETKIVLNSLLSVKLIQDKDHRRSDISDHPTYLYNNNPLDDVAYLFNKDVMFTYIYPMLQRKAEGQEGGCTSLDTESFLDTSESDIPYRDGSQLLEQYDYQLGKIDQPDISADEIKTVTDNVTQNVITPALEHPDTRFIYFIPPVSILFYKDLYEGGELEKTLQAERIAVDLLLDVPNIEVYSFNDHPEIIENLDNYNDTIHYGGWINTYILKNISEGKGLVTWENLEDFYGNEDYILKYAY